MFNITKSERKISIKSQQFVAYYQAFFEERIQNKALFSMSQHLGVQNVHQHFLQRIMFALSYLLQCFLIIIDIDLMVKSEILKNTLKQIKNQFISQQRKCIQYKQKKIKLYLKYN